MNLGIDVGCKQAAVSGAGLKRRTITRHRSGRRFQAEGLEKISGGVRRKKYPAFLWKIRVTVSH